MAMVRFAGGAMASIVNSVLSPREQSYLRFDFTDATVELTHLYGYDNTHWRYTPRADPIDWRPPDGDRTSHASQLPLLLDAMARHERPPLSGRQGRETLELVTALYRSAFTGRPVHRDQLGPDDPFYHHLHGGVPGWAPEGIPA
jgi:predicted dehydrogenase